MGGRIVTATNTGQKVKRASTSSRNATRKNVSRIVASRGSERSLTTIFWDGRSPPPW
jgi:hypothetical protein